MSLALIGLALVTHRAYAAPVTEPQPVPAVEAAPVAGYVLQPYCDGGQMMMHYESSGYPDGTLIVVTLGGTTWIPDQPVRDVEWNGDAYGMYIHTPDGTVQADTTVTWGGC